MTVTVKCDQMADGWNYDTCSGCRHFSIGTSDKGRYWRCKLNRGSAAEKRNFSHIWTLDYLIMRRVLNESSREEIIVDYVDKQKNGRKVGSSLSR